MIDSEWSFWQCCVSIFGSYQCPQIHLYGIYIYISIFWHTHAQFENDSSRMLGPKLSPKRYPTDWMPQLHTEGYCHPSDNRCKRKLQGLVMSIIKHQKDNEMSSIVLLSAPHLNKDYQSTRQIAHRQTVLDLSRGMVETDLTSLPGSKPRQVQTKPFGIPGLLFGRCIPHSQLHPELRAHRQVVLNSTALCKGESVREVVGKH